MSPKLQPKIEREPEPEVLRGWIAAGCEGDREHLEGLGVKVGPWNEDARCFDDCEATEDVDHVVRRCGRGYVSGLERAPHVLEARAWHAVVVP